MFEITWAPALAVFATSLESSNGTMGSLMSIASGNEIKLAAENSLSSIEVCLDGFYLAICIAGHCGNNAARSAYVHALFGFSSLGTGRLLEHKHIRCIQILLEISKNEGKILGKIFVLLFQYYASVSIPNYRRYYCKVNHIFK
jgi:hypothetical protein